jgi:hypothetical protein
MHAGHTGKIDDILAGPIIEHTIRTIAVGEHERVDAGASSQKIAALATAQAFNSAEGSWARSRTRATLKVKEETALPPSGNEPLPR